MLGDDAGRNAATLTIMRLPKKLPREGHNRATLIHHPELVEGEVPAGASKDEDCGLGAGVCGGCFEGAARHLSMRLEGEAALPY
ncbi:hypothetical protein [Agrobacterium vaccinii]|uniref:hypothetical protein n=1 Tax=Agrobacterium vaccinii TaxID=2735528 RepID=UPI001E59300B|nr:hypothetical protein [Agrobacterium vaccinii]UHS57805.1 hypothetical protein HRS00_13785 [Agrobacterium vaccinii]